MKTLRVWLVLLILLAVPTMSARADDEALTLDQLLDRFGWSFETAEIRAEKVQDGFYVLFGLGGNIAVSIGDDGVLIVDDQFPQLMPKIETAIQELGGQRVDYVINTHWHFDHAEGNLSLGPSGATIISHANSRQMMQQSNLVDLVIAKYQQQAYPPEAVPTISFERRMQLYFNGEEIELVHPGAAHTTGDAAVIFRGRNAVHMGDVFNNTGYPFIDAGNGGGIDGMIAFCRSVLAEIPRDAVVIPGHGEITDVARLEAYTAMLQTVRDRIAAQVEAGASLEEVAASNPTRGFEGSFGDPGASLGFLDRTYTSLKHPKPTKAPAD